MPNSHKVYTKNGFSWLSHKLVWLIRNRRKVVVGLIAGYILVGSLLASLIIRNMQATSHAQAYAQPQLISVFHLDTKVVTQVGEVVKGQIELHNPDLVGGASSIEIRLVTTDAQIGWQQLHYEDKTVEADITGEKFTLPYLAAQKTLAVTLQGTVKKITKPFVAVYAQVSYGAQSIKTETLFMSTGGIKTHGEAVVLHTKKPVYSQSEVVSVEAKLLDDSSALVVSGSIVFVQNNEKKSIYECSIESGKICNAEIKSLETGKYTVWFLSSDEQIFSKPIEVEIIDRDKKQAVAQSASLILPFGKEVIANRFSVVLDNVVTRNQKAIECTILIKKSLTQEEKLFTVSSGLDRACTYWISTNELFGVGEYSISVPDTSLQSTVFLTETLIDLPLAIDTTVLSHSLPITITSQNVPSVTPPELYTGDAELLLYNPENRTIQTLTKQDIPSLAYTQGSIKSDIPTRFFENTQMVYIALRTQQLKETAKIVHYSQWTALNFVQNSIDTSSLRIEVEDSAQLRVGGSPAFVVKNIRDTVGQLIEGRSCAATVAMQSDVVTQHQGVVQAGTCKVVLPKQAISQPGPMVVSFFTQDPKTTLPLTTVYTIQSGEIITLGSVQPETVPLVRNKATKIFIGPVKDAHNTLVQYGQLQLQIGSHESNLYSTHVFEIQNGFGEVLLSASEVDDNQLYIRVKNLKDEVLYTNTFITTDRSAMMFNLPSSIQSSATIKLALNQIPEGVSQCDMKLRGLVDKEVSQAVDLASSSCQIESSLQVGSSQSLLTVVTGETQHTTLLSIESGEPAKNFFLFPSVMTHDISTVRVQLFTSPLRDINDVLIRQGKLNLKLNGKILEGEIVDGIGKVAILPEKLEKSDYKTILSVRSLDFDMEGGASARARTLTGSMQIPLGAKEVTSDKTSLTIRSLDTTLLADQLAIARFNSPVCSAQLEQNGSLTEIKSLYFDGTCTLFITGTYGKAKLILAPQTSHQQVFVLHFAHEVPELHMTTDPKVIAKVLGLNTGVSAEVINGNTLSKKQSDTDTIHITAQDVAEKLWYTVCITAQDSTGSEYVWYRSVLGSQLLK